MIRLIKLLSLVAIFGGTASAQLTLPLTARAMNGSIANCSVVRSGVYNQLYFGPAFTFSGNYIAGTQDYVLESRINQLVYSGQCVSYDPNYVRSYLNLAASGQLPSCRVVPYGQYNQLYIYGSFQGNYLRYVGDATLVHVMARNPYCQFNNGNNNASYYIDMARAGRYQGCYVITSGAYNQFYLNAQFRGNYIVGTQDIILANIIVANLQRGICRQLF